MQPLLTEDHINTRLGELPPLAPTINELFAHLESGDLDAKKLQQMARHEPVLVGRLLRLANSPFYGMAGNISTLNEACLVLGSQTLRQLLLALTALQQLPADPALLDAERLWRHLLLCAALAQRLATTAGEDAELAFTAGLLHDIGKQVLAAWFTEEYRQVQTHCRANSAALLDTERALLGADHGEFGEKLLSVWHFPAPLAEAVGNHHAPGESILENLVHLADILAHQLEKAPSDRTDCEIPALAPSVLGHLGLEPEMVEAMLPEFSELAKKVNSFSF